MFRMTAVIRTKLVVRLHSNRFLRILCESQNHQPADMAEEYAAVEESTTRSIAGPTSGSRDILTAFLRDGARRLLVEAVEAEVADWIEPHPRHLTIARKPRRFPLQETDLAPLSPFRYEHINPYGKCAFDVSDNFGKAGLRSLRPGRLPAFRRFSPICYGNASACRVHSGMPLVGAEANGGHLRKTMTTTGRQRHCRLRELDLI